MIISPVLRPNLPRIILVRPVAIGKLLLRLLNNFSIGSLAICFHLNSYKLYEPFEWNYYFEIWGYYAFPSEQGHILISLLCILSYINIYCMHINGWHCGIMRWLSCMLTNALVCCGVRFLASVRYQEHSYSYGGVNCLNAVPYRCYMYV